MNEKIPFEPSQIVFNSGTPLNTWFLKISEKGIVFNREVYPQSKPEDFAQAFIDILEMEYEVTFKKRKQHE